MNTLAILLATSNAHKIAELKQLLTDFKVLAYTELMEPFEIEENGASFKENALLKAKAVFNALKQKDKYIVLSDDSGLCVDALGGAPGIYSARFSSFSDDKSNRVKLINELRRLGLNESTAHYVACIALVSNFGTFTTHGTLYGKVFCEEKGDQGFGYDSLFIPKGYQLTLAQLEQKEKNLLSHRYKALELTQIILRVLLRS
ncbi:RdgB/HAM1 family non-canonical purine NTP pyrophosphatase [Campylobacter sp. MIT 21-1685]|uniref:RdgB/HAM1 family non-canonical purine NTP pyrophosphatase n=1 Tax=unclassified Campylobacter TaxID=2593542 RepID=UPI00224A5034|nr:MULTISPECIES: RdgB/HAM1 family non-canonical purine NTP pyrophosphatase [unclassified Campylobacter]MCX2683180.1 RdgB/HAM1 family non-canonical purine NTP pyrophosphatase [Campylobacter sp. MIT 21-1684]MCX2751500.1 RdgB/HAM1 family non-canonical purine NTP pyrophosphatase [Campylobacter sp. MIT 21-1682]MCX2807661.1 RdgB/HAM1 family non-canonical purine NTP pyrophosphatase [Campylobacter sp. MIT 21-1685]